MRRADRHDRETFIAALLDHVPTATRAHALRLLRWGATHGRLTEAQCNGDYPADNGERPVKPCTLCESLWAPSSLKRRYVTVLQFECPSCRTERIIRETCESMGGTATARSTNGAELERHERERTPYCVPHFQGDPRGHTVRLQIAGQPLDAYERAALAVPTS